MNLYSADRDELQAVALVERNVAAVVAVLADWAPHLAARYNGPVLLLGSILHNPEPRDVDIRIVISDEDFAARYGAETTRMDLPETHPLRKRSGICGGNFVPRDARMPQRWIDDIAKFTSRLSIKLEHNVDLQVIPESWFHPPYPAPIVLAEPSPSWHFYNRYMPDPRCAEEARQS